MPYRNSLYNVTRDFSEISKSAEFKLSQFLVICILVNWWRHFPGMDNFLLEILVWATWGLYIAILTVVVSYLDESNLVKKTRINIPNYFSTRYTDNSFVTFNKASIQRNTFSAKISQLCITNLAGTKRFFFFFCIIPWYDVIIFNIISHKELVDKIDTRVLRLV